MKMDLSLQVLVVAEGLENVGLVGFLDYLVSTRHRRRLVGRSCRAADGIPFQ